MMRTVVVALVVGVLVAAGAPVVAQQRGASPNAQRLSLGYRSLIPIVGGFGPADYALNRVLAQQSLAWLARTGVWYMNDPLAARAYLDAYDTIGGFYRDNG